MLQMGDKEAALQAYQDNRCAECGLNDFEQSGEFEGPMNIFLAILTQIAPKEVTCTLMASIGGLSVFSGVAI